MTDDERMRLYDHLKNRGSTSLNTIVTGALFDFCAFLTYQEGTLKTGRSHEVPALLAMLEDFAKKRSLSLDSAAVRSWQDASMSLVDHCAPQINQLAKYILEYLPEEIKPEGTYEASAVDIAIRVMQRGTLPRIVLCPTCRERIDLNELTKQTK